MIALVTAGRGGGEGPPVFFTVPWSPQIEARGQMPGSVWGKIRLFHVYLQDHEEASRFAALSEPALLLELLQMPEFSLHSALSITIARRILLELGMLVAPPG